MPAAKGRDVLIQVNLNGTWTTVGGMRQKAMTINEDAVDVSDSDSAGRWRELLPGAGLFSMSLSGSGVFKDTASETFLLQQKMAGVFPSFRFRIPDFGVFEGQFMIGGIQYQATHTGEVNFSASFESAGQITFTAI